MKLYSYFRSSAAYRVRIALNLKEISYEMVPIHLTKDGGRQHTAAYRVINPQARVPALVVEQGRPRISLSTRWECPIPTMERKAHSVEQPWVVCWAPSFPERAVKPCRR